MMTNIDRIQPGWKVVTADNENAGEVEAVGGGELLIRKGWLFPSDHRLPITAVQTVDPVDELVYLAITREQVEGLADGSWSMDQAGGSWGSGAVMANDLDAPTAGAGTTGYATTGHGTIGDEAIADTRTTSRETTSDADSVRLQTHEEQLQARPVAHQTGEVDIRKEVVEEVQSIDVPVRREEVHIERHPVTGTVADEAGFGTETDTIRVPIMEERVEVSKVVRPVEEVEVSKRVVEGSQTVSDTVRREEIRVEGDEDVLDSTQDRSSRR